MSRADSTQSPQRSASDAYIASRTLGVFVRITAPSRLHVERFERELTQEFLRLTAQKARQKRHGVSVQQAVIQRRHDDN